MDAVGAQGDAVAVAMAGETRRKRVVLIAERVVVHRHSDVAPAGEVQVQDGFIQGPGIARPRIIHPQTTAEGLNAALRRGTVIFPALCGSRQTAAEVLSIGKRLRGDPRGEPDIVEFPPVVRGRIVVELLKLDPDVRNIVRAGGDLGLVQQRIETEDPRREVGRHLTDGDPMDAVDAQSDAVAVGVVGETRRQRMGIIRQAEVIARQLDVAAAGEVHVEDRFVQGIGIAPAGIVQPQATADDLDAALLRGTVVFPALCGVRNAAGEILNVGKRLGQSSRDDRNVADLASVVRVPVVVILLKLDADVRNISHAGGSLGLVQQRIQVEDLRCEAIRQAHDGDPVDSVHTQGDPVAVGMARETGRERMVVVDDAGVLTGQLDAAFAREVHVQDGFVQGIGIPGHLRHTSTDYSRRS